MGYAGRICVRESTLVQNGALTAVRSDTTRKDGRTALANVESAQDTIGNVGFVEDSNKSNATSNTVNNNNNNNNTASIVTTGNVGIANALASCVPNQREWNVPDALTHTSTQAPSTVHPHAHNKSKPGAGDAAGLIFRGVPLIGEFLSSEGARTRSRRKALTF